MTLTFDRYIRISSSVTGLSKISMHSLKIEYISQAAVLRTLGNQLIVAGVGKLKLLCSTAYNFGV